MTPAGYTEDELIEQPAIELFRELKWEPVNAYHEWDSGKSMLGRETTADVVLVSRLQPALRKLNEDVSDDVIARAVEELTRDRSSMSPVAANRELHRMLRDGVRVPVPDPEGEGETTETVRVIDWRKPAQNDFFLVSQLWITGDLYKRRTDLIGFVNGLPLVFVELKASHKRLQDAFEDNLTDYKGTISQLFWHNAIIILSNGSESRLGTISAGWEHFVEWKRISSEEEQGIVALETMIRGTCERTRLLDLVENFTLFAETAGGTIKVVAMNHQFLGVSSAIGKVAEIKKNKGRLGVFWHTQGSGKSYSMAFFSQKVLRTVPGNWTFVIVTDREDLDNQIYKTFSRTGIVTEKNAQATSSDHLRKLLREDHRYVFTLIQKFRAEPGEKHPVLSDRDDIIVIADEAHRTQYDTFALNLRNALPNAAFIAFTGTPLIAGEEKTKQVFGDYVSIYNFQSAVADSATVPLHYENRIPELQLTNKDLNDDIYRVVEDAYLDEDEQQKLERELGRQYHLITRDDRLERIARDIVEHFMGRGFRGKAMVVSIDKATAVRMYDKVRKHWTVYQNELREEAAQASTEDQKELLEKLEFMKTTDMAVVVSSGQNEGEEMKRKGLDIIPHRRRMVKEDLDEKFKKADDPLRLVFVCAMWMTGFDVPSCSTIYLDKPMRNHTLMQTIARANRVFGEKVNGLIVDYVGVLRPLQKALAIYGPASGSGVGAQDRPVEDKKKLVEAARKALADVDSFCTEHKVDLAAIPSAYGFARVKAVDDAAEAIIATKEARRYLSLSYRAHKLYRAILPDEAANELGAEVKAITTTAEKIRSKAPLVDISDVMGAIETVLDRSIGAEGYVIKEGEPGGPGRIVDLSRIDLEALRGQFLRGRKHTEAESLKASVAKRLHELIELNGTRTDFLEKFQELIEDYNSGAINLQVFFDQLVTFARDLTTEEQRHIAEKLSEEELAIFDLLAKPEMTLSKKEAQQVKKVARDMLVTLKKEKLVLDWKKRQQSRAAVRLTIEQSLDKLPDCYTRNIFARKCDTVFEHVFESYPDAKTNIYSRMKGVG